MEMNYNNKTYKVIYIEYQNKRPFSVIVTEKENSGYCTEFDFEFVYGDKKDIRYKWSGSGGKITEIQAPHYAKGTKNVHYWIDKSAKLKGKPKNIFQIKEPFFVVSDCGESINPFAIAEETDYFQYCNKCKHWMVEDCDTHQYYDDVNGMVKYKHDNSEAE